MKQVSELNPNWHKVHITDFYFAEIEEWCESYLCDCEYYCTIEVTLTHIRTIQPFESTWWFQCEKAALAARLRF